MKEIIVGNDEDNLRLDKLLLKYLDAASSGFIYKMLRKKNITLNGKKAGGSERLKAGDVIALYLSDDTISSFQSGKREQTAALPDYTPDIIYENDDIIIANKPAGLLSQKASEEDVSINEYLKSYCLRGKENPLFTPSVCNRLDRNTSGIITFGKTLAGSRELSRLFRERLADKYYLALVSGEVAEKEHIKDYLVKDEASNTVRISKDPVEGSVPIETEYEPLVLNEGYTLLSVKLITGKSHQIRAHLSAKGYPILGDGKYGVRRFSAKHQLLHARKLVFPADVAPVLSDIAGKEILAPLPDDYMRIVNKLFPDYIL